MKRVVLYYNRGTKCVLRMLVSIYSLRKVYNDDILVCLEGEQDAWFVSMLQTFNCKTKHIPVSNQYPLCVKPTLHQYTTEYDATMFLDADTLVLKPIDKYFDYIVEHGFVTGNFSGWKTTGGSMARRIKNWRPAVPELVQPALDYGTAINTGINGWVPGNPLLAKWHEVCQKGYALNCTTRIVDEIACQLVLPLFKHFIAGPEWGVSPKMGKHDDKTVIMHYHGHKHVGPYSGCDFWKDMYWEMCRNGLLDKEHRHFSDKSVEMFLKTEGDLSMASVTLVTAVNKKYLDSLKKNYPLWRKMPMLAEAPMLVFAHKDCCLDPFFAKLAKEGVTVMPWSFPKATSPREEMLSAFVFGVADYVKTRYWIKLDADCVPKSNKLAIPVEAWKATLVAKAWGYTKVKGDDSAKKHWLVTLDDWADGLTDFKGTPRLFPPVIQGAKFAHKRICTFFAIEKTNWTKHLADMCKRSGGRMPVPSQDTLTWYGITRMAGGRTIATVDFRKFFTP